MQGDIIAILNKDAEDIATYSYDAWGACTVKSDTSNCSIATVNPFRYRGYYYDEETELYYLQSRYYDAEVGRFVNGDKPNQAVTFEVLEINKYTYSINDPINNTDLSGEIATFIAKKIGSVIVSMILAIGAQAMADIILSAIRRYWKFSNWKTYISVAAKGAWDGLWGGGIFKEIFKSLMSNIISQAYNMIWKKGSFNFMSLLTSVIDGFFNYVIGKIIKVPRYIRDIKQKARSEGIKGLKKLMKYLNKRIWMMLGLTLTFSGITSAITQFIDGVFKDVSKCAKEMFTSLKYSLGGMVVV